MENHIKEVETISAQVKRFYDRKQRFRIYHGSTSSTRQSQYRPDQVLDTSNLSHIIKVDIKQKTVLVEPNVPLDRLVETTIAHGLIPPVVMEFPGITVGGGFSGTSGESCSFRHGYFETTVVWVEIVLANGEVVTASKDVRSDLFYGAASSFGTLGVTTLLEIQLVDAKPFVELSYHPVSTMSQAITRIEAATRDETTTYIDGIFYSKDYGIIFTGKLVDTPGEGVKSQTFTRAKDPWFYLHACKKIKRHPEGVPEAIPLVDYLFRYDRGGFWVGMYAFKYFITPFNRITRWILDKFMHTRVMYHALHQSGLAKSYIVQDVGVPYAAAEEFLEFIDDTFGIYPLWLCPLRQRRLPSISSFSLAAEKRSDAPEMLLNFGIWGPGPKDLEAFAEINRKLELKVDELGGKKCLYAHAYYTEEEFWNIYNRREYNELRAKYHATYLPSIYDKVKVDVEGEKRRLRESWAAWLFAIFWSIWPICGLYGVYKAVLGGDYLMPRQSRFTWKRKTETKEE